MKKNRIDLLRKVISCIVTYVMIGMTLFGFAGTIAYVEAWVFMITLLITTFYFVVWLYIYHPDQLRNRFAASETEKCQQVFVMLLGITFFLSLLVAGLDKRMSWTIDQSYWHYLGALVPLIGSVLILRNVFMVNPFLSNAVIIHEGQHIVQEGMYSYVRHPMYLAICMAYASVVLILGSMLNSLVYLLFFTLINLRAKYEEIQLLQSIPEYSNYMKRVRGRIIPCFIRGNQEL